MSCHVIWVHLHQLVVKPITLLQSLAKFHQFQVLRLHPIEVCQFWDLVDPGGQLHVALSLYYHQLQKIDFSGEHRLEPVNRLLDPLDHHLHCVTSASASATTCCYSAGLTNFLQRAHCFSVDSMSRLLHVIMYNLMSAAQFCAISGVYSKEILSGWEPWGCFNCLSEFDEPPPLFP